MAPPVWCARHTLRDATRRRPGVGLAQGSGVTTPSNRGGPLRVAFVGAGKMARLHVHALRRVATPHAMVAVCDAADGAAREFATLSGAVAYRSLPELLRDVGPQVVHVCTPSGTHFEPARAALLAGAHVYVEKPFVETAREAEELLAIAAEHGLLVCAGHQQVRDPAYVELMRGVPELGSIVQADCHFAFRPAGANAERGGPSALAAQLLDVLPHPLYTLVATLEHATAQPAAIEIAALTTGLTDVHAVLRANGAYGRLSVSLRARPVASTLSVSGTGGTRVADFIRTSMVGAANTGGGPLEKMLNPLLEAGQSAVRTVAGVTRRLVSGGDYPGLAELIGDFYDAVAQGRSSPLSTDHLRRVTALYEELSASVRGVAQRSATPRPTRSAPPDGAPVAVLTGARGFFGKAIARELARRGYQVRGISRSPDREEPHVHEWCRLDLSRAAPPDVFTGAAVVVHAAAESAGGYEDHQRNTIDVTRNVLSALCTAGVSRLVYVSSLSVLRPPRTPWERQDERTPLAQPGARQFGAYAWGKTEAERLLTADAARHGIETRIVRPAALIDFQYPELPGLVGRHLFGRWHLGFGRPALPFASCDVDAAAAAVAWCAQQFDTAPVVLNLLDPGISTRGQLLARLRRSGWRGRVAWIPISFFAALFTVLRIALGLATMRPAGRMAVWSIFRPRRYDPRLSAKVLRVAARLEPATLPEPNP